MVVLTGLNETIIMAGSKKSEPQRLRLVSLGLSVRSDILLGRLHAPIQARPAEHITSQRLKGITQIEQTGLTRGKLAGNPEVEVG